jgi:ribonuclease P protein component
MTDDPEKPPGKGRVTLPPVLGAGSGPSRGRPWGRASGVSERPADRRVRRPPRQPLTLSGSTAAEWVANGRFSREAHIPAQQPSAFEEAWLSRPHGHGQRPRHSQGPSGQGSVEAVGLTTSRLRRSRTVSGDHVVPPQPAPGRMSASEHRRCSVGRVTTPRRFRALQASTVRARSGPLRVSWVAYGDHLSVAYAVPTTVGNAVVRNTIRRRLRSLLEESAAQFPAGDLLVRVVGPGERCTWSALQAAVAGLVTDVVRRSNSPASSGLPVTVAPR